MKEFEYFKPKSLDELLELAFQLKDNKKFLAGGTDLIVRLKDNLIKEENIIDIKEIEELKGIKESGEFLEIGPLTTFTEIIESEILNKYSPLLVLASKKIGSVHIRNKGTIGGNLCNASPAGDSIPPLMCEEAKLILKSKKKERVVDIEKFFLGPGKTSLESDEILFKILIKKWKNSNFGFFNKLGQRNALTISIASNCVKIEKEDGVIKDIKIALGSVAPTVVRARKVEEAILNSKNLNEDELFKISSLVVNEIDPITDVRGTREYRMEVSKYLLFESLIHLLNL